MLKRRARLAGLTEELGRPRRPWTAALALAAVLAGCTGGSDEAAPIPTVELTTSTVPTTTTTTEPTTTAPPTTEDPNIALVEAAYRGHYAYGRTYGLEIHEEELRAVTAEPLLSYKIERLRFYEAEGIEFGENVYDIHITNIELEGTTAIVTSCNLDAGSLIYPNGDVYVPADEVRYVRVTELALLDIGWRVTDTGFSEGGKTACDL